MVLPDGTTVGAGDPDNRLVCRENAPPGAGADRLTDSPSVSVTNEFSPVGPSGPTPVALVEGRLRAELHPEADSSGGAVEAAARAAAAPLATYTCHYVDYPSRNAVKFTPPSPITLDNRLSVRVLGPITTVRDDRHTGARRPALAVTTSSSLVCFRLEVAKHTRRNGIVWRFAPGLRLCGTSGAGDHHPKPTTDEHGGEPGRPPTTTTTSTTTTTTTAPPTRRRPPLLRHDDHLDHDDDWPATLRGHDRERGVHPPSDSDRHVACAGAARSIRRATRQRAASRRAGHRRGRGGHHASPARLRAERERHRARERRPRPRRRHPGSRGRADPTTSIPVDLPGSGTSAARPTTGVVGAGRWIRGCSSAGRGSPTSAGRSARPISPATTARRARSWSSRRSAGLDVGLALLAQAAPEWGYTLAPRQRRRHRRDVSLQPADALRHEYRAELRDARNVTVVLHANALELRTDESAAHVTEVPVATLAGNRFRCWAQVVVAVGGLEVPRLLLLSDSTLPTGLGNDHDLVGRYFMDHIEGSVGTLELGDLPQATWAVGSATRRAMLALTPPRWNASSCSVRGHLRRDTPASAKYADDDTGVTAADDRWRAHRGGRRPSDVARRGGRGRAEAASRRAGSCSPTNTTRWSAPARAPICPVRLTSSVDPAALELVAREFGRAGIGRLRVDLDDPEDAASRFPRSASTSWARPGWRTTRSRVSSTPTCACTASTTSTSRRARCSRPSATPTPPSPSSRSTLRLADHLAVPRSDEPVRAHDPRAVPRARPPLPLSPRPLLAGLHPADPSPSPSSEFQLGAFGATYQPLGAGIEPVGKQAVEVYGVGSDRRDPPRRSLSA